PTLDLHSFPTRRSSDLFNSSFSMTVKEGNIRTQKELGGGSLYDIGVYCINAARHLFRAEPKEVMALSVNSGTPRLAEVDESVGRSEEHTSELQSRGHLV